mmetsp:Transcript_30068/g.41287  ORF Transcript_30068/g.41287 Transcript_30068/m.41287 type:complete len:101 (+) Transcript_30068:362-664(+)
MSKITTLNHKVGDDPMESRSFIVKRFPVRFADTLLTSAKSTEILNGLWDCLTEKSNNNSASCFSTNLNIEKNSRCYFLQAFSIDEALQKDENNYKILEHL